MTPFFSRQKVAVQVRFFTPSPGATIKRMVDVLCQMPPDIKESETSLEVWGTLHEISGECDGHVCVTEHETVKAKPASTSAGTPVITGFSGEAADVSKIFL